MCKITTISGVQNHYMPASAFSTHYADVHYVKLSRMQKICKMNIFSWLQNSTTFTFINCNMLVFRIKWNYLVCDTI